MKTTELLEQYKKGERDFTNKDLCGANLRGADLNGANLCKADLSGANLCKADLSGANLNGADLCGADLCKADLNGANLRGADLNGANLRKANLNGADLNGANLRKADLRGADLNGAKNIYLFNKKDGRACYAIANGDLLMIQAGCFWGTLDEFERAALDRYGDDENKNYKAQIKYLRTIK